MDMPNEMTAEEEQEQLPDGMDMTEIAKRVQKVYIESLTSDWKPNVYDQNALRYSASVLRRVASGELAPVVHAHWIKRYDTLSQDYNSDDNWYYECSKCGGADSEPAKYCHRCNATMDESGKDDSHED